ncbi:preprotein translocase subunit YajC [uncultured Actinomyces sp.]|uniref:preprotein translocase subunit YajC n=1 Tax=uncultured Actinomyces sp. TaxID=249061 RepID=UPI0028E45269|nr:preprotein translocase subunit YajC [uncultured Actinomyces sp.]
MNNYTLMGLLVVMIAFMWWSSRSRKKQMEKMEQDKREQLAAVTPGEWVRTRVGFWGRFVDLDGDIVVLETTDGHEMYWEREMIAEIGGQPPLASTEDDEAIDGTKTEEISDEDEAILGLDDAPSSKDSDEQQK